MARVTDPALLEQLNGGVTDPVLDMFGGSPEPTGGFEPTLRGEAAPKPRKKVVDPALLQQLNGAAPSAQAPASAAPADDGTMLSRGLEALGSTDVARGVHQGVTNRGIGVIQTGYDVMKTLGLVPENPEFEAAIQKAKANVDEGAKGTGVGGFLGELAGDPINWVAGGKIGGAAIKGLGKKEAVKILAKQGAKAGAVTGALSGATGVRKEDETRAGNTLKYGAIGAATGAAIPAGTRAIGTSARGTKAAASDIVAAGASGAGRTPEMLNDLIASMKGEGDKLFTRMRESNVNILPGGGQQIVGRVRAALSSAGLDPDLHPHTVRALQELEARAAGEFKGDINGNPGLDVVAIDNLRRKLSEARGQDAGVAGKFRAAMFDALKQNGVTDGNPEALNLLDQALGQWQKASRFQDVAELANKANSDPNRIRTVFNNFTDDPANTKLFTQEELDALLRAGERTFGDKALGLVGRMGIDMGSISRNPNFAFPWLVNTLGKQAVQAGGTAYLGGPVPVGVGTIANVIRNRVANGRVEKALRLIEQRQVPTGTRQAVQEAVPVPRLPAPSTPLALPAPENIMIPGGPGGALRAATPDERSVMYRMQGRPVSLEVPPAGAPRAPSAAQQQVSDTARTQYQQMGLTPDVLAAQRGRQVTAAEAQKAIQDAAAQRANAAQLASQQPQPTVGEMFTDTQSAAAERAAAAGKKPPSLSNVGQALLEALRKSQGI